MKSEQDDYFDFVDEGVRSSERRLPRGVRDPGDTRTSINSLTGAFGDPAVDPNSGGVFGTDAIAAALNVSTRQVRNYRADGLLDFERWVGDMPATNIASLEAFSKARATAKSEHRRWAATIRWRLTPPKKDSDD